MNIVPVLVFGNLHLQRDLFAHGGPRMRLAIEGGEIHVGHLRYRYKGTSPDEFDRLCQEISRAFGPKFCPWALTSLCAGRTIVDRRGIHRIGTDPELCRMPKCGMREGA